MYISRKSSSKTWILLIDFKNQNFFEIYAEKVFFFKEGKVEMQDTIRVLHMVFLKFITKVSENNIEISYRCFMYSERPSLITH